MLSLSGETDHLITFPSSYLDLVLACFKMCLTSNTFINLSSEILYPQFTIFTISVYLNVCINERDV